MPKLPIFDAAEGADIRNDAGVADEVLAFIDATGAGPS
jgi:hypothetical protein